MNRHLTQSFPKPPKHQLLLPYYPWMLYCYGSPALPSQTPPASGPPTTLPATQGSYYPPGFLDSLPVITRCQAMGLDESDPAILRRGREHFPRLLCGLYPEIGEKLGMFNEAARARARAVDEAKSDGRRCVLDGGIPEAATRAGHSIKGEVERQLAKAFEDGKLAAFRDIHKARKRGFKEGVRSIMSQQIEAESRSIHDNDRSQDPPQSNNSLALQNRRNRQETDTVAEDFLDTQPPKTPISPPRLAGTGAKDNKPNPTTPSFWTLMQFSSYNNRGTAMSHVITWQTAHFSCALLKLSLSKPPTLSELMEEFEKVERVELEAMAAAEENAGVFPASSPGFIGLQWLQCHNISGVSVVWNHAGRKVNEPSGVVAVVTERNVSV